MAQNRKGPQWQPPGTRVEPQPAKAPRDYIGAAVAALSLPTLGTSVTPNRELLAAIIVAQALDRLGERIVQAAAVNQYKRD